MTEYQKQTLAIGRQKNIIESQKNETDRRKSVTESANKLGNTFSKEDVSGLLTSIINVDKLMDIDGDSDIAGFGGIANVAGVPVVGAAAEAVLSDEGKKNRQAIAGVRNTILKLRSGGAITENEQARLLNEIGEGLFKSDEQLRIGMRNIRDILRDKIRLVETTAHPDALAEFRTRKGAISSEDEIFTKGDRILEQLESQTQPVANRPVDPRFIRLPGEAQAAPKEGATKRFLLETQ
jgi:hypothetical protein